MMLHTVVPVLYINCTNMNNAHRFVFCSEGWMGETAASAFDHQDSLPKLWYSDLEERMLAKKIMPAMCVAASAAVPGAINPLRLAGLFDGTRVPAHTPYEDIVLALSDGGASDNTGIATLLDAGVGAIIASNAGSGITLQRLPPALKSQISSVVRSLGTIRANLTRLQVERAAQACALLVHCGLSYSQIAAPPHYSPTRARTSRISEEQSVARERVRTLKASAVVGGTESDDDFPDLRDGGEAVNGNGFEGEAAATESKQDGVMASRSKNGVFDLNPAGVLKEEDIEAGQCPPPEAVGDDGQIGGGSSSTRHEPMDPEVIAAVRVMRTALDSFSEVESGALVAVGHATTSGELRRKAEAIATALACDQRCPAAALQLADSEKASSGDSFAFYEMAPLLRRHSSAPAAAKRDVLLQLVAGRKQLFRNHSLYPVYGTAVVVLLVLAALAGLGVGFWQLAEHWWVYPAREPTRSYAEQVLRPIAEDIQVKVNEELLAPFDLTAGFLLNLTAYFNASAAALGEGSVSLPLGWGGNVTIPPQLQKLLDLENVTLVPVMDITLEEDDCNFTVVTELTYTAYDTLGLLPPEGVTLEPVVDRIPWHEFLCDAQVGVYDPAINTCGPAADEASYLQHYQIGPPDSVVSNCTPGETPLPFQGTVLEGTFAFDAECRMSTLLSLQYNESCWPSGALLPDLLKLAQSEGVVAEAEEIANFSASSDLFKLGGGLVTCRAVGVASQLAICDSWDDRGWSTAAIVVVAVLAGIFAFATKFLPYAGWGLALLVMLGQIALALVHLLAIEPITRRRGSIRRLGL